MVLVLCPASHRGMIHKALNGRAEFVMDWQDVMNRAKRAACLVLDIERLPGEWTERIRSLRARAPRLPIVLVLPLSIENAAPLDQLPSVAFVWRHDAPTRLRDAAGVGLVQLETAALLERVGGMADLNATLRNWLTIAITASPAIHTTKRLAAMVGKSESTLQEAWSRAIRRRNGARLKDFLTAVLAYRAATLARSGAAPEALLRELGVSKPTLERVTRRVLGVTPHNLAAVGKRRLISAVIRTLS